MKFLLCLDSIKWAYIMTSMPNKALKTISDLYSIMKDKGQRYDLLTRLNITLTYLFCIESQ